jgi:hypothetical protein
MRFVRVKSAEQQGSVDAASHARSADAAAEPGDQCLAGAYGRTRYCGGARLLGIQRVEVLLKPMLGRDAGIDGAAEARVARLQKRSGLR